MTDKNKVDSKKFNSLIESIGNSFDEAKGITKLKSVLKGLGFEDKGERKLGGGNKGIDCNGKRCKKYECTDPETKKTKHRCLGGIYIFSITKKTNCKNNLDCFTQLWRKRTKKGIPLVNEEYNEKYLYVGKDINNLNTRISNHFGASEGSTYALKLASEDIIQVVEKYNITCHRFTLNDKFPEYAKAGYIAMIEGILHEKLKPILGRR